MKKRRDNIFYKISAALLMAALVVVILWNMVSSGALPWESRGSAVSGTDWTLDRDGRLTIRSNEGMADWCGQRTGGRHPYQQQVKSVEMMSGVTGIGAYAFQDCAGLKKAVIPESVTSIGEFAFYHCGELTDVTLPEGVTELAESVFNGCKMLRRITLQGRVKNIGDSAFQDCASLSSFTLPESVESIGEYAFIRCLNLKELTIPDSVAGIGASAFSGCTGLTNVTMRGSTPPELYEEDVFGDCGFVTDGTASIWVPTGKAADYREKWAGWAEYIADDVLPAAPQATVRPTGSPSQSGNFHATDTGPGRRTWDAVFLGLFVIFAVTAGFVFLRRRFVCAGRGMTDKTKREFDARIVAWAKRGGKVKILRILRKLIAVAAVFLLSVYYHIIEKSRVRNLRGGRRFLKALSLVMMLVCVFRLGQAYGESTYHWALQATLREKLVERTQEASALANVGKGFRRAAASTLAGAEGMFRGSAVSALADRRNALYETDVSLSPDADRVQEEQEPAILDKYAALYEENNDLVGWLSIEGMNINYPVMQSEDDEYYLHHDFYGLEDQNGSLYVRRRANLNDGTNFVIYGHCTNDHSMFGDLSFFRKESFFKEHPVISFDTLYEERTYEILAVFRSQVYNEDDDVFKYYQFYKADTQEEFDDFYNNIKKLSLYDTGVEARFGDTFLTLSTCAYHVKDGRFAVVAKRAGDRDGN